VWDNCEAEQAERPPLRATGFDQAAGVERGSVGATLPDPLLRRTFEHIERNLDSKLKWDDLAAAVGLEPFRFARGFKRATGMTLHRYIMAVRVRRARELLAGDESSIANVALDVGCSCQSHLTTLFRMHTGTTPAAFRRAVRQSRRVLQAAAAGAAAAPRLRSEAPVVSESASV
jgi:AraC-like DNA-binding protein